MKQSPKSLVLSGILFGISMGIIFSLMSGWLIGIISGSVAGITFVAFFGLFIYMQPRRARVFKRELSRDFTIVHDGGANHSKGIEAVGGWLFLTNEMLLFKSHSLNIQKHMLNIPLVDIDGVEKARNKVPIQNGMVVKTKDGKMEKFIVNGRDVWIEKITEAVALKTTSTETGAG